MSLQKLCQNNDGDGCGELFGNKSSIGLCAKCNKLATLKEDSVEYAAWLTYAQCKQCGVAWKHFKGGVCGGCQSAVSTVVPANDLDALTQKAKDAARQAHVDAVAARLHKTKDVSTLHTTEGLDAVKANTATSATEKDKILITFSCRVKTGNKKDNINFSSGSWAKAWDKTDYISEVKDDAMATVNVGWEKKEGMSLLSVEVDMRWNGNKVLLANTLGLTINDFIKAHTHGSQGFFYETLPVKPADKSKKDVTPPLSIGLELYIDKPAFLLRKERVTAPSLGSTVASRKRRGTYSLFADHDVARPRTGSVASLSTSFIRTPRITSLAQVTSSMVTLTRARIVCDEKTGEVDISWPSEADSQADVDGTIGDVVFSAGKTKKVFKLVVKDELLVAKRFFNCGNGAGEVTAAENESALISEITRLKSIEWLLSQFKDFANSKAVDIAQDIIVTQAWLFRESSVTPSKASGLSSEDAADLAVWLVEPRRTKSVEKYSGTLLHPSRDDKIGITLCAFAHYIYMVTKEKQVIADIQGSLVNIEGVDTTVLFDIMTHTVESDSGVGDFGSTGIDTFASQHKCNHMCEGLDFQVLNPEEE